MDINTLLFSPQHHKINNSKIEHLENVIKGIQNQTEKQPPKKKKHFNRNLSGEKIVISDSGEPTPISKQHLFSHQENVPIETGNIISIHKQTCVIALSDIITIYHTHGTSSKPSVLKISPIKSRITSVQVNPVNPNHFLTSYADGTLILWSIDTKSELQVSKNPKMNLAIKFTENHVVQTKWHPTKEPILVVLTNYNQLFCLNTFLLANEAKDNILTFSPTSRAVTVISSGEDSKITDMSFSQTLNVFVASFFDGNISIWDSINFVQISTFLGVSGGEPATSVNFLGGPLFHHLVVGGPENKSLFLWKKTGQDFMLIQTVTFSRSLPFTRVHYDVHCQQIVMSEENSCIVRCLHIGKQNDKYVFDYIHEFMIADPIIDFAFDHGRAKSGIEFTCVTAGDVCRYNISEKSFEMKAPEPVEVKLEKQLFSTPMATPEKKVTVLKRGTSEKKKMPTPSVKIVEEISAPPAPTDNDMVWELRKFEANLESKMSKMLQQKLDIEATKLVSLAFQPRESNLKQMAKVLSDILIDSSKVIPQVVEKQSTHVIVPAMNQAVMEYIPNEMVNITVDKDMEFTLDIGHHVFQEAIQETIQQTLVPTMKQASNVVVSHLDRKVNLIENLVAQQNKQMIHKLEKLKTPTSGSPHPGSPHLKQNVIEIAQNLILHQKYNDAFVKVLNANDPRAVQWLIKQLNPEIMQELSQGVILTLMMQISRDFTNELVERMKWIKIACDHLRPEDQTIAKSVGRVLEEVLQQMGKAKSSVPEEYMKKYNRVMHFVNSLYQSSEI